MQGKLLTMRLLMECKKILCFNYLEIVIGTNKMTR
jgi:hypothetical protein